MKKSLPDSLIIQCYKKDIVLKFKNAYLIKKSKQQKSRREIKNFSWRSQRRLRLAIRNTSHLWKIFVDLTYPKNYPSDGKKVKKHLDTFIKRLTRYYQTIKFLWVIEFQDRGAPHFHILTNEPIDKNWLSQNWYEVVNSGDEKHLKAGTRVELIRDESQAIAYVSSYLKKLKQKIVPKTYRNIGRFWSHSSNTLKSLDYEIYFEDRNKVRNIRKLKRNIRTLRRWYFAKLRSWNIRKWKWKGQGFIAWDGMEFFKEFEKRNLPNDLIGF